MKVLLDRAIVVCHVSEILASLLTSSIFGVVHRPCSRQIMCECVYFCFNLY